MNWKCLFGHKWNGCKCEKCGETRDEGHNYLAVDGKCIEKCSICNKERNVEHIWNGCKCERCGEKRKGGHKWTLLEGKCIEKCSICSKTRYIEHKWRGCKCEKCGETRKEGHKWTLLAGKCIEKCSICNKERDAHKAHQWSGCKCEKCGETIEAIVRKRLNDSRWSVSGDSQSKYYSRKADNLINACEILKQLSSIPPMTYYLVDTPDGTLGRDIIGFFTESPLKTKGIQTDYRCYGKSGESVESQSLMDFGDMMKTQIGVATIKANGKYANYILMMKCGQCGYESPIETKEGDMERECYFCGTNNKTHRADVNVYTMWGMVKL